MRDSAGDNRLIELMLRSSDRGNCCAGLASEQCCLQTVQVYTIVFSLFFISQVLSKNVLVVVLKHTELLATGTNSTVI